ncbi:enoyl-CoA hydratase-related protein [Mycolicibacterium baixiangningiae]|uniref:enoyl-CoA hydratase-related protein n=1 Tax=Mycolicibacterium baixiangningiae TaxID=2761578 RepID=UPI0018675702|nr:enoyl-CoA hydratase-related protein [Mycolicibacterium baixiangningiae]
MAPNFDDVLYDVSDGIATITINRPEVLNAFRVKTVNELISAFRLADSDPRVGAIILTGAGDRAFSAGGDQKERQHTGQERDVETGELARDQDLHAAIRGAGKPVIAAVNGYAIGGGHVLHVLCDLSIASENAIFGQVGPKVGSFDAGLGTIYLARVVGEKRAREMWYLCRRYSAQEALDMNLVNKVVPLESLMDEARAWAAEIVEKSPTAIRFLKHSFNSDTASATGTSAMAFAALELYQMTDEATEGNRAFNEKRPVDYAPYRR